MYDPGQRVCLRSSARTDMGKVRSNNEDSIHLWTPGDHTVLAIVADGMGGAVAGEEASRIAVETIRARLTSPDGWRADIPNLDDFHPNELVDQLQGAILDANNQIAERAAANPELRGMGTTVTLALIHNTEVVVGHVGDSRAYLVDGTDGYLTQITSDHTLVQALVEAGHISAEEAEAHPMKNVLYRALGQSGEVDVDVYPERMHVGDRLVLCSDGLTLHVKPDEIAKIVMAYDPAMCSQLLIDLANERGGHDNISVIVIKVESPDDTEVAQIESTAGVETPVDPDDTLILAPVPQSPDTPEVSELPESKDGSPPDEGEVPDLSPDPKSPDADAGNSSPHTQSAK